MAATREMTYYELPNGAKVFAAGAFTLAEDVWKPEVGRLVDNLWSRLGGDAEFAVERRS